MAEKKFQKGSDEWMMFMEFWKLCQKYWIPEASDGYWDDMTNEVNAFAKKYGCTVFVKALCIALVKDIEVRYLEQKQR